MHGTQQTILGDISRDIFTFFLIFPSPQHPKKGNAIIKNAFPRLTTTCLRRFFNV